MDFRPRQQIIYVPLHANGDLNHPDCQAGFVTSMRRLGSGAGTVFCRYWSKHHDGLRTQANSEGCDPQFLVKKDTRPQELVDRLYDELYGDGL